MALVNFAPLYTLHDNRCWPTLQPRQRIPAALASTHAVPGRPSAVGLGMVKAVCTVLFADRLAGLAVDPGAGRWTAITASWSVPGTHHVLGGDATTWWTDHVSYLTGVVALLDALTLARTATGAQELVARWTALLQVLTQELGTPPPYTEAQRLQVVPSRACTDSLMAVTDALYFCAQTRARAGGTLRAVLETADPQPLVPVPGAIERWVYGQGTSVPIARAPAIPATPPPTPAPGGGTGPADTGPVATLRRLIRRGGTALLVGPTGVGKSLAARQAAISEGAALVLVEGWPGLEDRDLYGRVYPVEGPDGRSFAWVDGPLAEAWRLAAAGGAGDGDDGDDGDGCAADARRVVLVLDELARFDPYHLAPLMGALDRVRGAELQHLAGLRDAVRASLQPEEDYRVLKLPNGERLLAPAARLSVFATTNLGADYIQTQQEFDAALLRRFDLHLDVGRLEGAARRAILVGHGLPPRVADVLVAIEDYSAQETGTHNGLLRRELNLGTCVSWATEGCALVREGGYDWAEAVRAAAELTAIPFACPRDSDGYLEAPAAASLREQIRCVVAAAGV